MALTIPESEIDMMKKLTRPAFAAIALTNDLYSWKKELADSRRDAMPHVVNAIWVLMRELSISEAEAMDICRQKIKEYIHKFQGILESIENNDEVSQDLKKYMEALQYSHSGNLVWSVYCPRYGYKGVSAERQQL